MFSASPWSVCANDSFVAGRALSTNVIAESRASIAIADRFSSGVLVWFCVDIVGNH